MSGGQLGKNAGAQPHDAFGVEGFFLHHYAAQWPDHHLREVNRASYDWILHSSGDNRSAL